MTINTQKLRERIDAAIKRITSGSAPMRVPADQTDPDLVLADAKIALDAQAAEIARLRTVLAGLIAVCEPNIYPQPDKPNSPWAVLQTAHAALQEKSNG